jgi:DnaK suppressor protein
MEALNLSLLPNNYDPLTDAPYMNARHLLYFQDILSEWRERVQSEMFELGDAIKLGYNSDADEFDRAAHEVEIFTNLRRFEALKEELTSIDRALSDIENGKYGFCRKTGEKIGIERLMAKPDATLCLKVQKDSDHKYFAPETQTLTRMSDNFVQIENIVHTGEVIQESDDAISDEL